MCYQVHILTYTQMHAKSAEIDTEKDVSDEQIP